MTEETPEWEVDYDSILAAHLARRPPFYWARNELWRRAYLQKTRGIPFEPLDRAKLERWFMPLADELDTLEREEPWFDQRQAGSESQRVS